MKHDFSPGGDLFRLRPVAIADAAFILRLRSASGQFLNRGAKSEAEQRCWIECYLERPDDYYFVIERVDGGHPEGLVGIYDVDRIARVAEWGRFVLIAGSVAAVEATLLVYRCGIDWLGLDCMRCRTLVENAQVVSFHDSCGLERASSVVMVEQDGGRREAIEHVLVRERWPIVHERLSLLAHRLAMPARMVREAST